MPRSTVPKRGSPACRLCCSGSGGSSIRTAGQRVDEGFEFVARGHGCTPSAARKFPPVAFDIICRSLLTCNLSRAVGGSLLTVSAIGALACVAADMVHEALGHGTAAWLTGDRILSLSTVAIQNATASRFVSAAGTSANWVVGILSLLAARRVQRLTSWAYVLWIFGAYNVLNSGYLVTSAVLNSGDWRT
jgi:hypothetical protein